MWFYVGLEQTWFEVWGLVSFGWFEIWFGVWGTKLSVTQGDQIIFLCLYSFAIGVIGLRSLRKRNLAFIFRYYGLFTYHTSHAVATSCSFLQLAVLYWLQLWYLCWFLFLQILSKKLLQKYENTTWHLYHWVHTDCLKFTTNTKNHVIIIERNFFKWYGKVRQDITSATTFTIEFREYSLYSLPIHILFLASQRLHHPAHCMSPIYNSNYFASTYQRDFYNNPVVENLSRRPSFSVGPGNPSIKQG